MNKTLVIYYSYTGDTKRIAEQIAKKKKADLCEVVDLKRPSTLKAYTIGCFMAFSQKKWDIDPVSVDFDLYTKIIIMAPIWAGYPSPQFNSIIDLLPPDKIVSLIMVSGSGHSSCKNKVISLIESKGCKVSGFHDFKGNRQIN